MSPEHCFLDLPTRFSGCHRGRGLTSLTIFRGEGVQRRARAGATIYCVASQTSTSTVNCYNMYDQVVPYEQVHVSPNSSSCRTVHTMCSLVIGDTCMQAWRWQQQLLGDMLASEEREEAGSVILLQHEPVFTLGAGSTEDNLKFDASSPPMPLFRTERGGEVTYHGPGQLVLYPILDLKHFTQDLHWYLRSLEEVIIR